ncbi:MAG TPA: hypothetical protein VJU16_04775, partial [Planctomycetota bacterium]|nr:hypothetical protein [Planctomycetota bacterium]
MRTLKTALLFAVVLFSMAPVRPASPQEGYAYQDRRFRGMNSTQVYQRWLNPVLVDGVLYPDSALPQAPRHYSGGGYLEPVPPRPSNVISTLSGGYTWGSDTQFGSWLADFPRPESRSVSVSVDSRGVAHLAGVLGNGATWNIYYYNNRFDSRRANGFSAPLLIAEGAVSLPSIAASPVNDGVYIVYLIANGSVVSRYLNPSSGTWDAEVSIFPGGGAASYMMPTAKVSDNGVLNVVCLRTQTGAMDIVRFAGGVITSVPGTVYDSLRPGQLVDFRFALYGTQASVVWQYRLPDEGINVDSDPEAEFYERRGGIEASILGAAAQPISNNTDPRIRAWQEVPDVAHAPNGTAHFAWVQARVPGSVNPPDPRGLPTVPPIVYHYAADGTTNLTILYSEAGGDIPSFVAANVIAGGGVNFWFPRNIAPRVVCDQMNRPHVFTGDGARRVGTDWTNRTIRQAIRV